MAGYQNNWSKDAELWNLECILEAESANELYVTFKKVDTGIIPLFLVP